MVDFIKLTCPSCGAKFEETQDTGYFVCAYCGQKHMIYIGGGIITLKSIDELKNDAGRKEQTSVEIAIERINGEIETMTARRNALLRQHLTPKLNPAFQIIGSALFILFILIKSFGSLSVTHVLLLLVGVAVFILGVVANAQYNLVKTRWEIDIAPEVERLDEQLALKQAELQQVKSDGH